MTGRKVAAELSDSKYGSNRHLEVDFGPDWDLTLLVSGGVSYPNLFRARHGSEATFVSAMLGYYARAGVDKRHVREELRESISAVSEVDNSTESIADDWRLSILSDYATGLYMPVYDVPEFNLECLVPPISAVPGPIEKVGGTGVYTRKEKIGGLALVLASIAPGGFGKDMYAVELCQGDIPIITKAIGMVSMGDSRQEISSLYALLL